ALGLDRDTTRAEREALLLADRCAALLIAGQNIFSARTRSPILDAVRQAVLSLLPAGRCVILDATLLLLSGPTDVHYSRSVAQHAIESGRPVEAIDDRIADAGSTLCVPFVVRDAPGGCLYLIHESIAGVFSREHRQVAEFLAALAGASLEQVEAATEVERLEEG